MPYLIWSIVDLDIRTVDRTQRVFRGFHEYFRSMKALRIWLVLQANLPYESNVNSSKG